MSIIVKELSKIYGSGENQVTALDRASMEICDRDFISIVGPSGSGKSTLCGTHVCSRDSNCMVYEKNGDYDFSR